MLAAISLAVLSRAAIAQQPPVTAPASTPTTAPSTAPATAPATAPTTAPAPAPLAFPLAQLGDRADETTTALRKVDATLAEDAGFQSIDAGLRALTVEITGRLDETSRLLSPGPSLETLVTLERDWSTIRTQLADWSRSLSHRADDLQRNNARLADLLKTWEQELAAARASAADPTVVSRISGTLAEVGRTRDRLTARTGQVSALQGRITAQDVRAADALASVRDARARAVERLLDRDSPPLWSWQVRSDAQENLEEDTRNSMTTQWSAASAYTRRQIEMLALHALLIGMIAAIVVWMRRRWDARASALAERTTDDVTPADVAAADHASALTAATADAPVSVIVFRMPLATAIVATLPLIPTFYAQAPRLFLAIIGAAMFIPAVLVLRRLALRPFLPLLYGIVAFYFLGLVVRVTVSLPALSRGLLLVQTLGGIAFLAWYLRATPRRADYALVAKSNRWTMVRVGARIAFVALTVSSLANLFGYAALARLLGNAVVTSAYVGLVLDACVRVADALLAGVMYAGPLAVFGVVKRHGALVRRRIVRVLGWGATLWWALITLQVVSLREPVVNRVDQILNTRWGVGAVNLSLGGLLAFGLAIVAAFLLSRFARFLLEEDVYPRVHLARGVPYAISTLLHYVILFVGFLVAIAALGYDMTKFTILAGAFGVGLGFGMQNIVSNFVSGLILLFERPIQVGDVIELDPQTIGTVASIGIRASVIRTSNSAEVIVPNSLLIANRVTNWTLSNRQRGIVIPIGVQSGTDQKKMTELLLQAARNVSRVATLPPPQAYCSEFLEDGGMRFELCVWANRFDDWVQLRSEVLGAIDRAMHDAGVKRT